MSGEVKRKRCAICGVLYNSGKYWQRFCSKSCRQASWAINKIKPELLEKILKGKIK